MYNKVVVPLDGSKLAETVLPHLEEIAGKCSIPQIYLVSVTEKIGGRVTTKGIGVHLPAQDQAQGAVALVNAQSGLLYSMPMSEVNEVPISFGKMEKEAFNYLCKIASQLEKKGFNTIVNVLIGNPAEEILKFVEKEKADIVVMASRGKSGISRWDMGNIAEKVVRNTQAAVLLVKPAEDFKETKAKRKAKAK
jgi:nucleotide-binding universal stress UspA family protein